MNNSLKIILVLITSVALIFILKPFVDDYKEEKKYAFNVNTWRGNLN